MTVEQTSKFEGRSPRQLVGEVQASGCVYKDLKIFLVSVQIPERLAHRQLDTRSPK